jgi:hypothetical protein
MGIHYPHILNFDYDSAFYREHPLEKPLFFESGQLVQVEAERREHHFRMHSENGSDASVSGMEHILDNGIRAFTRRSDP